MAIVRQPPRCLRCGEIMARAIYKDQSSLPPLQRIFGDTFLRWEYFKHECKAVKIFNKTK